MDFRDLGPLLVESDGLARPPGGARLSTALAVLLSRPGEAVATASLIAAIWGPDAPARSAKVLESHIWRLRKVLEPEREPRAAPSVLLTDPVGYRLAVAPESIDSRVLASTSESMRGLLADHNVGAALSLSEDALSRWRGDYCADVSDMGWLAPVRERLADLRLDLIEFRATALMEVGQPERAVNELAAVIAENPLRERLWLQRILGLYQSGRQAAALSAYDHIRRILGDELGVDPGPELSRLHQQILDHDERLFTSRPETTLGAVTVGSRAIEVHLPSRRASFVGRHTELRALTELLDTNRLVTVLGPGGVGKTRLATEVAFHARTRFPDGVWFVDLAPITSSDSIPALLANTFALRPIADTPIVTVILDHLAASRLLIILDNCEHLLADTAALVDMILDATDGVQVVATSREPLDVDGEYRYPLAPMGVPAPGCSAAEFVESAAAALFLARLAHGRSGLDLDGGDAEAIARICAAVGGLPLGIELAAARARTFDLDAIVASLEQSPAHLARNGPGPQRHSNMLNTVDWGYRLAGNDEQVLHSRLAVFPGAFTLEAAAVLCSFAPLSAAQALDLVGGLAHRSLLVAVAPEARGRKTTFAQLVPIRAHADHTLTGSERTKAEVARDRWVIERILSAPAPGGADQPAYYDWIEDNEAIVRAVLRSTLVERRDVVGLTLLSRMIFFWHDREQIVEMLRWTDLAETYFRTASLDDSKRAALDAVTGCAQALAHNTDAAERLLGLAVPVLENPPDDHVQESTRLLFVVAVCAWSGDVFDWSTRAATAVVELSLRVADIHTELGARGVLAAAALITGDSESALSRASAILADNVIVGNNFAALFANITYSIAAKFAGDGITGLRYSDEVLRTQKRLGTHNFSESFETRANHLVNAGQLDEGARYLGLSYALSQRQGRDWPWHPGTDEQVSELRETLGAEFDEHWNSGVRMGQVDPSQLLSDLELSTVGETGSSRVDRPSRVP